MRIATYRTQKRIEVGVVSQDGSAITPFDIPPQRAAGGLLALLEGDQALQPLRDVDHPLNSSEVELLAPIPRPRRNIFCVGKNYFAHIEEIANAGFDTTGGGTAAPEAPILFSKFPECVIPDGAAIMHDAQVTQELDYEAELAVIIGRTGRAIPQVDALDYVWGYTIVNDVTARDVQKRHKQWLLGKSQDTFCPMGPFAVTRDLLDLGNTPIRCWVNGDLRQDGNTELELTRFRGYLTLLEGGFHDAHNTNCLSTGLPATDDRTGTGGPQLGRPGTRV